MTLKEKFDDLVPIEFGGMQEHLLNNCEKIADEFAIGFAEWYHSANSNEYHLYPNSNIKEHLKIYKKEKGL